MRHATREGNRPSFWTYLKVNGCRGGQRQDDEEEKIHRKMNKAFQRWRTRVKHEGEEPVDGKEEGDRRLEKER
eukprot:5740246-Pleurochrysis_carterae.AAC.1